MSRGLNKVQLIGRLGRDPEMRFTTEGKPVTNFSLATGGKWTDRDGNERDDTEWFRVEAWDRLAETCNNYLTKGTLVYIEGRLKTRKWVDRETGMERSSTDVVANNMIILSSKNSNNNYQGSGGGDEDSYDEGPAQRAAGSRGDSGTRPAATRPAARGRNQPQAIESDDDIPF